MTTELDHVDTPPQTLESTPQETLPSIPEEKVEEPKVEEKVEDEKINPKMVKKEGKNDAGTPPKITSQSEDKEENSKQKQVNKNCPQ